MFLLLSSCFALCTGLCSSSVVLLLSFELNCSFTTSIVDAQWLGSALA